MKCSNWLFGTLALSLFCLSHGSTVFMISPSNKIASCQPMDRCFTLSQFAANSKNYLQRNSTLFLQPGNHTLESELQVLNVTHFSLRSLLPGSANIACTKGGKLMLHAVKAVYIKDITFTHCIGNKVSYVGNILLSRSTFVGPSLRYIGTAIHLNNTNAQLLQCLFSYFLFGSVQVMQKNVQQTYSLKSSMVWTGGALVSINSNVTILQSRFEQNRAQFGGAVYARQSNVTIISSLFDFNTANSSQSSIAASGSALFAANSTILIHNTTLTKNNVYYGYASGGAISIIGSNLTVQNSLMRDNSVIDVGGGLNAISSRVSMINCICHGNKANIGGTFALNASILIILGTVLKNNRVGFNGGVISATKSTVLIQTSSISDNFAQMGGVIYSSTSLIKIQRSIVSNSVAIIDGGAIYCRKNCEIGISNSMFVSNAVEQKGGVIKIDKNSNITISRCRFNNNTASSGGVLSADPFYNVIFINQSEFRRNSAYAFGGAIEVSTSVLNIFTTSFIMNRASAGGVIRVDNSSLISNSCMFSSNSASRQSVLDIVASNASFSSTSIRSNAGERGIISLRNSNGTFTNSSVSTNVGSTVAINSWITFLGDNTFWNNVGNNYKSISMPIPNSGGALTLVNSTLTLNGPTLMFMNNSATCGGAINANMSSIINEGRLIAFKNSANDSGGAMYLRSSELQCNGTMHFLMNSAMNRGGGVDAVRSSMRLSSNCSMLFDRNFAAAGDDIIMDTV